MINQLLEIHEKADKEISAIIDNKIAKIKEICEKVFNEESVKYLVSLTNNKYLEYNQDLILKTLKQRIHISERITNKTLTNHKFAKVFKWNLVNKIDEAKDLEHILEILINGAEIEGRELVLLYNLITNKEVTK